MGRPSPFTAEQIAEWREFMSNPTHSYRQAGEVFGVYPSTVSRYARRDAPRAIRVSPEAIANWKAALDEGYAYQHVAEMYGVAKATVRKYLPGRGWTPQQIRAHAMDSRRLSRV